ncbi:MAG: GNAT family N-acetyltransferase [Rhodobacterales bacterium]
MMPEAMTAIHAASFQRPRPWGVREFRDLLASDTVFLSAHDHGFALGRIAGPEVELLTLAVAPDQRRRGIAAGLMQDFIGQAKAKGASEAFLEVAEDNHAAIALYRRFDFRKAGHRKDYYADMRGGRVSALVMTRQL